MGDFNSMASDYDESIKSLPPDYIRLIGEKFNIKKDTKVIDLGCGSGLLTYPLSLLSNDVIGIDISPQMIRIAKRKNEGQNIKWVIEDVSNYNFGENVFDLIISYESLHLMPNTEVLLSKCAKALRPHGFLCMAYCYYNWELLLEEVITSAFAEFGIEWGEWSFQKFDVFRNIINNEGLVKMSKTVLESIDIPEAWTAEEIATYITSISKATELDVFTRTQIKERIEKRICKEYGKTIRGNTKYCIQYTQKEEQ